MMFRDWKLTKIIGTGSFGTVYEAENTDPFRTGERAAIKKIAIPKDAGEIDALRSNAYTDASITETFKDQAQDIVDEYRIMKSLSGNTNIVNCDDVGCIQHDNGFGWDVYIVMELLTPMRKLPIDRFTEAEVLRLGKDICSAISVCQKHAIIHRDVKPDNIFVSADGNYKLGDFGISRALEGTRASTIGIGTYEYMAPEVQRESYDRTVDIYSLGLVLYWLLNERRTPFLPLPPELPTALEKEQARKRRFQGEAIPAPAHGSEELKRIVLKACAFDPKDRYQSAEDMLRELKKLGQEEAAPPWPAPEEPEDPDNPKGPPFSETPHDKDKDTEGPSFYDNHSDPDDEGGTDGPAWIHKPEEPEPESGSEPEPEPQPFKKKKRGWIWGIVAAAAVVICAAVILPRTNLPAPSAPTAASFSVQNTTTPTSEPSSTAKDSTTNPSQGSIISNSSETINIDELIHGYAAGLAEVKIGFIFLRDENSTYDYDFLRAAKGVCEELNVSYVLRTNVPNEECYTAAAELIDDGCNIVFSDYSGHEDSMITAARKFPDVEFCCAAGTKAVEIQLDNYHNAYAAIHEGRYLAGVAAGMKLNQMIDEGMITADEAVIGYVGAFPYPEVKSAYTAFYLGARSICPTSTMKVSFTNSWYDEAMEASVANALIQSGCKLISQYADSFGAPKACEAAGIPNISGNGSTIDVGPNTFIVSSYINWAPYMYVMIGRVACGEHISTDWTGTLENGGVQLTLINEGAAAPNTQMQVTETQSALIAGSVQVFDTDTFTVSGKRVTSCKKSIYGTDNAADPVELIKNGAFQESVFRSFPVFDLDIDGITIM